MRKSKKLKKYTVAGSTEAGTNSILRHLTNNKIPGEIGVRNDQRWQRNLQNLIYKLWLF